MRARLVALEGQADICLDRPLTLVGRHRECDVRINSPQVSRQHCCLAWHNGAIEVRDLGSTNGTKINGSRIISGRLSAGDELGIGRLRFLLIVGSPPAQEQPGAAKPEPESAPLETLEMTATQGNDGPPAENPFRVLHGDLGIDHLRRE